jgi:hypothetical protein
MSDLTRDVLAYLTPRREAFWQWAGPPMAVAWRDGRTIAFRQELAAVLTHLAPGGLPPFGAVLMVLAACRDNWPAADNARQLAAGYEGGFEQDLAGVTRPAGLVISLVVPASVRSELAGVVEDLDRIAALPAELRTSVAAKCAIVETVFEGLDRAVPPHVAQAVARTVADVLDPDALRGVPPGADDSFRQLAAELEALQVGLGRIDAERLRLRLQTGLDQGVSPAQVDVPDAMRVRQLLGRLRDDPELAGVTRVARDLLAAIHVPRALAAPQELPVGGVSDLSNRGELDRLLVSELAQDDLTLMTRVALNEALYLRREAPRHSPPHDRVILVDTGVRVWGLPRVFATGVALALAASADKAARVRCFRPAGVAGAGVEQADLTTRDGLIAQLAAIGAAPHPGSAARAMIDAAASESENDIELVVITHEDAANDPDFVRALDGADRHPDVLLATVNRDGTFRLLRVGRDGRRVVCGAQLSLEELLAPQQQNKRPAPIPLVDGRIDPTLPVILSTEPFPLLLPARADPRRAVGSDEFGLIAVTHDRRLMRWRSEQQGAEQLVAAVPPGTGMGLFVDEEARTVFYVSQHTPPGGVPGTHLLLGRPDAGPWHRLEVTAPAGATLRAAAHHGGVLLLMFDRWVQAVTPTGAQTGRSVPTDWHWHSGRFYHHPVCTRPSGGAYAWSAAHFDGHDISFAPATGRSSLIMFDRDGGRGPWQLLRNGLVASVNGPTLATANPPLIVHRCHVRIAPDGNRIMCIARDGHPPERNAHLLDLKAKPLAWRAVHPEADALLVGDDFRRSAMCGLNIRNRFSHIYAGDVGDLVLVWGQRRRAIRLDSSGHLTLLPAGARDGGADAAIPFRPLRQPHLGRFTLREARWSDGSRAILDSRGMLHLTSTGAGLPEITLALTDQTVGGWTSDGLTFGWAFFHRDGSVNRAEYAYGLLRTFTARLR